MLDHTENIFTRLKEIIDRNGPDYLTDKPYEIYLELKRNGIDSKNAGAVLYALVSGVQGEIHTDSDLASLSGAIQKKCCFNKKMAESLATVFLSLYSQEHKEEWKEKELEGLSQFLEEKFEYTWKGFAVWDEGNGTVDCYYEAEIVLAPGDPSAKDRKLAQMLRKNPFLTKESIHEYYEKKLREHLDYEFKEYCNEDDYYPPVVEDFGISYCIKEWCSENGFELVSCEGSGDDSGYEPKFRRGGW